MEVSRSEPQVWVSQGESRKLAISWGQEERQTLQKQGLTGAGESWARTGQRSHSHAAPTNSAELVAFLNNENLEDFARQLAEKSDLSRVIRKPVSK